MSTNATSSTSEQTSAKATIRAPKAVTGPVEFLDQRLGLAKIVKGNIRKVFPDHWSFLLGEIALYSFIIILLSGVFLTLWFKPSMQEVVYDGPWPSMNGVEMSEAFASTLDLSFEIKGGLLMRQIHHWAALLFMAAMLVHMLRIFFTGAFRKPRELNWIIGLLLIQLGFVAGLSGYSLPDDLLSGTGLRFMEGLILAVPVVGSYVSFFIFGGEFPGDDIISRFYPIHILLIPGLILALIAAHLGLVVYHKHTQFPGPGRTNKNVVGYPLLPVYMAKAGGYFFVVFGVLTLMSATMQINPVWVYGPYDPAKVGAGTQPDWYLGWVEGGLRIMPNWETHVLGFTISWNIAIPGLGLLGLILIAPALYPFIERWVTRDQREHHILDRPRNQPTRTGLGVAAMTFYAMLWIGGGNDVIATHFHLAINHVTWFLRIFVFLGPIIAFIVTRRICIGLQRRDKEKVLHGRETGIVMRLPHGEYIEVHEPISEEERYTLTQHDRQEPISLEDGATDENGVAAPGGARERLRARASRFYFGSIAQKPTAEELAEADSHGHGNGHDGGGLHELSDDERTGGEVGAGKSS